VSSVAAASPLFGRPVLIDIVDRIGGPWSEEALEGGDHDRLAPLGRKFPQGSAVTTFDETQENAIAGVRWRIAVIRQPDPWEKARSSSGGNAEH
jgi:hypothetical protein